MSGCKRIADYHRAALGFLTAPVFTESAARGRLLVAETEKGGIVGFVRFNHRRAGTETALYDIAVDSGWQGRGIGRELIGALANACRAIGRDFIVLRCPDGLAANVFYERIGFQEVGLEPGRRRPLRMWRLIVRESGAAGDKPCSS